jgi:hypothetical protein
MSFEVELHTALRAALAAEPGIAAEANGVHLERPVRASVPYLVIGEMISADWSAKGMCGREVRLIVRVHDEGESWARAAGLQGAVSRAVEALPRQLEGWQLGGVTFLRSRTLREGTSGWIGAVEYRVRAMEV